MNNKKIYKSQGFTLVELLAIIVILAVIAFITVPVILNVVDDSKEKAAIDSVQGIKKTLEQYYISFDFKDEVFKGYNCTFPDDCEEIDYNGKKPSEGQITIDKNGKINGTIVFDDKYIFNIENDNITHYNVDSIEEYYLTIANKLLADAIKYSEDNTGGCYVDFNIDTNNCNGFTINGTKPISGQINIGLKTVTGLLKYSDDYQYEIINNEINLIDKTRENFIIFLDFENGIKNDISKWDISYNTTVTNLQEATVNNTQKYNGNNSCYFDAKLDVHGNELKVVDSENQEIGNVYTFDLFYNPNISNNQINYNFFEKGYYVSGVNGGFSFRYDRYNDTIGFIITNGRNVTTELKYTKKLENNKWYRITVTSDGTTLRMFLDGKLVNSLTSSQSISAPGYALAIGGKNTSTVGGASAGGYLDDVYVNVGKCLYTNDFN